MSSETDLRRIELPKPEGYRCFGCGTANPCGLQMRFYSLGDSVRSDITLNGHHVGWENIAHGGIISTILDETMAWAVVAFRRVFFVTRTMEVRYLRPVQVNEPLTAVGEISPEPVARGCLVEGSLMDGRGAKLAVARAEMIYLPEKRLPLLPDQYKRDMEDLFRQMRELLG